MKYFVISTMSFFISLCLILVGLFTEDTKYGYIIAGLIFNYIGLTMLIVGAVKKKKLMEKAD
ncbi:hypothetical protein [Oceanobacillus picturae]|uniref:hypothetical protein n=1 Tax=Oceanobacillus picturae TaxID=171693 RepID=UPI00363E13B1